MKLERPRFSADIDADLAVTIAEECLDSAAAESGQPIRSSYRFNGVHQRTGKGDSLEIDVKRSGGAIKVNYDFRRDSLYHILPEVLFHQLDRYTAIELDEEDFERCRREEKARIAAAIDFFYPYDKEFLKLRERFQRTLNLKILNNYRFITDFITAGEQVNMKNPFIARVYGSILRLRSSRGSETLLLYALNEAFEGSLNNYNFRLTEEWREIDQASCHISLEGDLTNLYCGPKYCEPVQVVTIEYQTKIESHEAIQRLEREMDEFGKFFSLWFLGMDQRLEMACGDYKMIPILGDATAEEEGLFLGYNTQLI